MQKESSEKGHDHHDDGAEQANQYDEIKTTLNLVTHSITKIDEDTKDRAQLLREEFKAVESAMSQQIQDLQNKIAMDESTLQHKVQIAFDKTNGKFKEYFETMMHDHQKQMASIGNETNQRFLQNNKDIEKYLDGQLIMLKQKLL